MDEQTISDIDEFWNRIRHFAVAVVYMDKFDTHRAIVERLFEKGLIKVKGFNRNTLENIPSFIPEKDFEPLDFIIYFWDISDKVMKMKKREFKKFEFSQPIIIKG